MHNSGILVKKYHIPFNWILCGHYNVYFKSVQLKKKKQPLTICIRLNFPGNKLRVKDLSKLFVWGMIIGNTVKGANKWNK